MSEIVPAEDIERIVGTERHLYLHLGRAVSAEQTVYVLHSRKCLDSGIDLRECAFSVALDSGIVVAEWQGMLDRPVVLNRVAGRLVPSNE